jgi:hypothetical protein
VSRGIVRDLGDDSRLVRTAELEDETRARHGSGGCRLGMGRSITAAVPIIMGIMRSAQTKCRTANPRNPFHPTREQVS